MVVVPDTTVSTTSVTTTTNGTTTRTISTPVEVKTPSHPTNGSRDPERGPNVSPRTYHLLLQQVENLRLENNTLKAELKNNTSHISKLENEASSLKDMVILLGINGGNEVETTSSSMVNSQHGRNSFNPSDPARMSETSTAMLPKTYPSNYSNSVKTPANIDLDAKKCHPELGLGPLVTMTQSMSTAARADPSPPSQNGLHGSVSPPPSSAVADAIKKHLSYLIKNRAEILKLCQFEEQKKDFYMKQLTELNQRLDSISESDKFAKPNDKTRQQLEIEISKLKNTMEQSLGTPEAMEARLQSWLKQIQDFEKEIKSLKEYLRKLVTTPTSPEIAGCSSIGAVPDTHPDHGSCSKHASYVRGKIDICEMSTQTPHNSRTFDEIIYEEEFSSCDSWNLDVQISAGGGKMSRPSQTIASCLAGRKTQNIYSGTPFDASGPAISQHDPLASRSDNKPLGSMESLPSQSDIDETASMHSFTTSLPKQFQTNAVGAKKDGLQSPSSLLSTSNRDDLCRGIMQMCKTVDGCTRSRQSGYLSLIIKIMHDGSLLNLPMCWSNTGPGRLPLTVTLTNKAAKDMRLGMAQALRNIVHVTTDITRPQVEVQILNQLEIIRAYCEQLFEFWLCAQTLQSKNDDSKKHAVCNGNLNSGEKSEDPHQPSGSEPVDFRPRLLFVYRPPMTNITNIMKISLNEAIRNVVNELGGLYAIAELFILHCRCVSNVDQVVSFMGNDAHRPDERTLTNLSTLRRYVGFALTNLTFGDMVNKATLIQMPGLVDTVMAQIEAESEEMQQVMARFLRNLSWQPDEKCRDILRQKSVVTVLMKCALRSKREVTLQSVLSALWNLSGHCSENRASICAVKGALAFLVSTLTYRSQTKSSVTIIESGGGILRNVSSVVATNEEYRQVLRENNCLPILLTHLKASSLTIVSNACGTLWNLSARNSQDQKQLWELGAVNMLRNLVHSKHSVIAQGSNAALRNLLANRPENMTSPSDKKDSQKLQSRKQKILESVVHPSHGKSENFSPRHHAWGGLSPHEKISSPRSTLSPQRRSLQETSSSSPVPEIDKNVRVWRPGLHYSGSLGSLPNTELGETFPKPFSNSNNRYMPGPRNSNSYPDHYSSKFASNTTFEYPANTTSDVYGNPMRPTYTCLGGTMKDVLMFTETKSPSPQGALPQKTKLDDTPNKTPSQAKLKYLQGIMSGGKIPHSAIPPSLSSPQQPIQQYSGIHTVHNISSNRNFADPNSLQTQTGLRMDNSQLDIMHGRSRSDIVHSHSPYHPIGPIPKMGWTTDNTLAPADMAGDYSKVPNVKNQVLGLSRMARNPNMPPINMSSSMPNPEVLRLAKGGCPEDLARRLQNVEEDYNDDDDLVNYSLQYRDEDMTPGIRSPRTEEIYETQSNEGLPSTRTKRHLQSQLAGPPVLSASANGVATLSDEGLSTLSSCIGSTGSNTGLPRQENVPGGPTMDRRPQIFPTNTRFPIDPRMVDPANFYDMPCEEEKPTNFGAIYSEEKLYDPIESELVGMISFSNMAPRQDQFPIVYQTEDIVGQTSDLNNPNNKAEINDLKNPANEDNQEEEDKFDTGAITPAHYYHHKSGRNSGVMTPRTPMFQETPLVFSRTSSLDSISSCDAVSINSSLASEPGSRMMSGIVSPSQLPDSPSQSMPVSPRRSPRSMSLNNLDQTQAKTEKPESSQAVSHPDPLSIKVGDETEETATMDSRGKMSRAIEQKLEKLDQPGYLSSLPHHDETSAFKSEGAMSVMTTFSSLTIDSSDKIQPIVGNLSDTKSSSGKSTEIKRDRNPGGMKKEDMMHPGQIAVMNAGYITSLPTNDEIKNFMHEGSMSPMTSFSEISLLKESNDEQGFHRSSGSNFSVPNSSASNKKGGAQSVTSNKNSFASRSSATGASVPPPAPDKWHPDSSIGESSAVKEPQSYQEVNKDSSNVSNVTSPMSEGAKELDVEREEDSDDDSDSPPSSDVDDLLKMCIENGLPKKKSSKSVKSTSSKSSSRGSKSSKSRDRSKDKTAHPRENPSPTVTDEDAGVRKEDRSVTNPSPEVVRERIKRINIKQKLEAADTKLNGQHIVEYIEEMIAKTEVEGEDEPTSPHGAQGGPPLSGVLKSKQVIGNVETLEQTYSVKKRLKETEKLASKSQNQQESTSSPQDVSIPRTTGFLPSELTQTQQSNFRLQSYLREGIATSYATEGTPIEMSRSTSLSNLTIESDGMDHPDLSVVQNRLKTSHSVPDIKLEERAYPMAPIPVPISSIPLHVHTASNASGVENPSVSDSREILEDLGRQIQNISLSTAESVITGKNPGYLTSLPQSDEIKKFASEGSQSGLTVFSALTIDSDTRIAPSVPVESITNASLISNIPVVEAPSENVNLKSEPLGIISVEHGRMDPAGTQPEASRGRSYSAMSGEDISIATSSSANDVTVIHNVVHKDETSKQKEGTRYSDEPNPNSDLAQSQSHYSENEPIQIKEGPLMYKIEDTPLCFSSNSSLSSLDFGSDDVSNADDLLNACITSALPAEKKNPYPPPPHQILQQFAMHQADEYSMGSYGDRLPEGKVDSSLQDLPVIHAIHPNPMQVRGQTFISSPVTQSPTDEQWAQIQEEANVISAQLLHQPHPGQAHSSIHDLQKVSPGNRNGSMVYDSAMMDPDIGRSAYDRDRIPRTRKTSSRSHKSDLRNTPGKKGPKGGKKYPGVGGRQSSHHRGYNHPAQDSSSTSSTSYPQNVHGRDRHMSESSGRMSNNCNKYQYSRPQNQSCCGHHNPVSASTSHLVENIASPSRSRRRSTNSGSKNSARGYDHNMHHPPRQPRPRPLAKNEYHPSVTQIYPPLKDMNGVLRGVASVAARGDRVVADRANKYPVKSAPHGTRKKSSNSSSGTTPSLVKQGTFITDSPSPVLLQNMTQEERDQYASKSTSSISSVSPPQSRLSDKNSSKSKVASPRGSTHSLKSHSVVSTNSFNKDKSKKKPAMGAPPKAKHNKVWNGIKRLLSPSEEAKPIEKTSSVKSGTSSQQKDNLRKEVAHKTSKSPKTFAKKQVMKEFPKSHPGQVRRTAAESGSSLSLSSSSVSNNSDSEAGVTQGLHNPAVAPFGHLPKSPSVNALSGRHLSNIPHSSSTGVLQDRMPPTGKFVWRRTPPPLNSADSCAIQRPPVKSQMSSGDTFIHCGKTSVPPAPKEMSSGQSESQDVWVSKKDSNSNNLRKTSSNCYVPSSRSRLPIPQGQNHVESSDGGFEVINGEHKGERNEQGSAGFLPPPRTQSPRVVQQVAPFNYIPSPKKPMSPSMPREKMGHTPPKISPDCKQTSV